MDLHMLSLRILVPERPGSVFYVRRHQFTEEWRVAFFMLVLCFDITNTHTHTHTHTHTNTHPKQGSIDWHIHINMKRLVIMKISDRIKTIFQIKTLIYQPLSFYWENLNTILRLFGKISKIKALFLFIIRGWGWS